MEEKDLWKLAKARVDFKHHLRNYVGVNILLWVIYILVNFHKTTWDFPWPIYIMLIWGLVVALQGYRAYSQTPNDVKREYEKLKKQLEENDKNHKPS